MTWTFSIVLTIVIVACFCLGMILGRRGRKVEAQGDGGPLGRVLLPGEVAAEVPGRGGEVVLAGRLLQIPGCAVGIVVVCQAGFAR